MKTDKTLIFLPLSGFVHKYCGYNERLARMGEIKRSSSVNNNYIGRI